MTDDLFRSGILITGASSGVGVAAARAFADAGARVAMLARRGDVLDRLADELGDAALAFPTDVADPEAVSAAVGAPGTLGGLDLASTRRGSGCRCRSIS